MFYFTTANFNLLLLLLERREGTRQRTPEVQVSPQIKLSHAKMDCLLYIFKVIVKPGLDSGIL